MGLRRPCLPSFPFLLSSLQMREDQVRPVDHCREAAEQHEEEEPSAAALGAQALLPGGHGGVEFEAVARVLKRYAGAAPPLGAAGALDEFLAAHALVFLANLRRVLAETLVALDFRAQLFLRLGQRSRLVVERVGSIWLCRLPAFGEHLIY